MNALVTIPIDLIEVGQRLRGLSEAQVESLVASIADVGLLNPITVYPRQIIESGIATDGYGLVAGAHRLAAYRRLGLVDIAAQVVELSELERQIAECDENLCGSKLTPSERAMFTKRRKDAYEALHPETKHGGDRASRQLGDLKDAERFTSDTAVKTGQSERVVQRDAERGAKIIDEAIDLIRGTKLDTGSYLDKLKKLSPNDQVTAAKRDLAHIRQQERERASGLARRIVKVADQPLNDEEAREKQVAALMAAWNKASAEARQEFLERIDTPVFDRGAA